MRIDVFLDTLVTEADHPVSFEADSWLVREDGVLMIYKNMANPVNLPNARRAQVIGQFNKQAWAFVVQKDKVQDAG